MSFSISEFSPPITPAIATGFLESAMTKSFSSNVLSTSSNVVIFSPFLALLTFICFPSIDSMSNACIG